jgi:two-component system, OmpR family, phosphate regulon sensor histidine kinase PhoR
LKRSEASVIDSKMSYNSKYPWFFYYKLARLSLLIFLPMLLITIAFDQSLFGKVVPLSMLGFILYLIMLYQVIKPLRKVLNKLEQFRSDIPFNKSLQLLYKKNEWATIEEALNEADSQIKTQVVKIKAENEKIAAILESIHDDIIAIDAFETVLFYNTNFKRDFIKERSGQELILKFWHILEDENILAAFRHVLKKGEPKTLKAIRISNSLRPEHFFDLTITSLKNAEGIPSGALGVFHDVTEFKLTEQMRVDFVANISHEIRTPLTSIKGYTQILEAQKQKIEPELHLFLQKILSNTERMISLFNDLLSLSVIESQSVLTIEEIEISTLIDEVTQNITTNYPNKIINIKKVILHPLIKGSPRLIELVLSNLIDNACKYSGDDILITLETKLVQDKSFIIISDNGPGIPSEHLNRIFERFYRIDSSRESSRGTGLGLSIVKHIIAKHNGKIWAESTTGKGASFIIELPNI